MAKKSVRLNLMDVLRVAIDGNTSYVPIQFYNRIGEKVTDGINTFTVKESVPVKVTTMNVGMDKLNLNFRTRFLGTVLLSDQDSDSLGLSSPLVETSIFRYQNLVKDGQPNMDSISLKTDIKTAVALGVELGKDQDSRYEVDGDVLKINLKSIPLIDRDRYMKPDWDQITQLVDMVNLLQAYEKVDSYYKSLSKKEAVVSRFNEEQKAILAKYGLSEDLMYVGDRNKPTSEGGKYFAHSTRLYIKGAASLPSVDSVRKKIEAGKDLNRADTYINIALNDDKGYTEKEMHELLMGKIDLFELRVSFLTNNTLSDMVKNNKGDVEIDDLVISDKMMEVAL